MIKINNNAMNHSGKSVKILFTFILSVFMILQPVVNAYAMTSMMHNKCEPSSALSSHAKQNTLHSHSAGTHKQMADCTPDGDTLSPNQHNPVGAADDCCSASACCAASITAMLPGGLQSAIYSLNADAGYTFSDVTLPIEIKPPRI